MHCVFFSLSLFSSAVKEGKKVIIPYYKEFPLGIASLEEGCVGIEDKAHLA